MGQGYHQIDPVKVILRRFGADLSPRAQRPI
jgi:hypothetical protein